jgi:hypothetical protein
MKNALFILMTLALMSCAGTPAKQDSGGNLQKPKETMPVAEIAPPVETVETAKNAETVETVEIVEVEVEIEEIA